MGMAKNEHSGMVQKRKYECPICGEYTLYCGKIVKCIMGCKVKKSQVNLENYYGYFMPEQIDIILNFKKEHKEVSKEKVKESIFTQKQFMRMQKIVSATKDFNDKLDKITIDYFSLYPDRQNNNDMLDCECFFCLLEDMNVFLNRISKDIALIDFVYRQDENSIETEHLFSISFYYYNLAMSFYSCFERFRLCLGIMNNIEFEDLLEKNNATRIEKKIYDSKNVKGDLNKKFKNMKNLPGYGILKNWREETTHNISKGSQIIIKKRMDVNRNRNKLDFDIIANEIGHILDLLEKMNDLYKDILEESVDYYNKSYDVNLIKRLKKTGIMLKIEQKTVNTNKFDLLYKNNIERMKRLKNTNSVKYEVDIIFRMFEAMKSLSYVYAIEDGQLLLKFAQIGMSEVLDYMDREYLLHVIMELIYDIYNKLAKIFAIRDGIKQKIELINFENVYLNDNNGVYYSAWKRAYNTDYYKFLCDYRNDTVHVLRKGCLLSSMSEFENMLIYASILNLNKIDEMLEALLL